MRIFVSSFADEADTIVTSVDPQGQKRSTCMPVKQNHAVASLDKGDDYAIQQVLPA